ncbi:MAG TPA: 3-deoxy-7-phosphoheptulonate synthase [Myxococcota bacterium]|jgi:3-deoxy-7-phosphoheptulonate synthase
MNTSDLRITHVRPLIAPAVLMEEIPLTPVAAELVARSRRAVEAVLDGRDARVLLVVGPCSIHDPRAALEYADKLRALAERVRERLLVVMRVYFEKPRTVVGWKGLINDPDLDGSYRINQGLRLARGLLAELAARELPAGTEFLDTTLGQFYADLVAWGAIGARTAESQVHRELASGLSMPVGIKNRTDGDVGVAIDAIRAARAKHLFPSLTQEGAAAILETSGNPYAHLVLRGGAKPNWDAGTVDAAAQLLREHALLGAIMVDCSHANSERRPERQREVALGVAAQRRAGQGALRGLMLESHLVAGRQEPSARPLVYGQSVTDACLGWDDTERLVLDLADALAR